MDREFAQRAFTGLLVAMVSVSSGCFVRGGEEARRPLLDRDEAAETAREIDPDWLDGRLPDSLYEGSPKQGGTLVVRLHAEPPSLNMVIDSDLVTTWIVDRNLLESMAELDASKHPDYPLRPALAESWEISEDGLEFTFRIRRGVKWHDGKPFTGRDVVATVEKILDPKVRSMHLRNYFEDLVEITTPPGDDFTVIARYRKPYFMAFRVLAGLPILPKHILDEAGDLTGHPTTRAPIGTGPFKFKEWKTAERIVFERNDDYWRRPAYLDKVVFRLVEDDTVAFQLLQQGKFDLFVRLNAQQWAKEMLDVPLLVNEYHRSKFFIPSYSWMGWNQKRPFFQDRRVRLAMTYMLDREAMRKYFLHDVPRMATCHFYEESANCPDLEARPYDLEKAKALLDEAGWVDTDGDGIRDKDGVPFRFTFLMISSSPFQKKMAPYMQQQLWKLGIEMEIKKVEWALFTQMLREHRFDLCSLAWGSTDVVGDPFQVWHSSQSTGGSNYISFGNEEADRLIEQAREEMDDDKRAALYRRLGEILHEENPYTFLYGSPMLDTVRRNVRGLRPAVSWYDLADVWLAD